MLKTTTKMRFTFWFFGSRDGRAEWKLSYERLNFQASFVFVASNFVGFHLDVYAVSNTTNRSATYPTMYLRTNLLNKLIRRSAMCKGKSAMQQYLLLFLSWRYVTWAMGKWIDAYYLFLQTCVCGRAALYNFYTIIILNLIRGLFIHLFIVLKLWRCEWKMRNVFCERFPPQALKLKSNAIYGLID